MISARTLRCITLTACCVASPLANGHGANVESAADTPTKVVRFSYTAGQPMDGARVQVLMPDGDSLFQVGRTDPQGYFAFVPDRPGTWIVEANDERGHKLQGSVAVGASAAAMQAPSQVQVPRMALLAVLLVSLLANAGLLSALIAAKKRTP